MSTKDSEKVCVCARVRVCACATGAPILFEGRWKEKPETVENCRCVCVYVCVCVHMCMCVCVRVRVCVITEYTVKKAFRKSFRTSIPFGKYPNSLLVMIETKANAKLFRKTQNVQTWQNLQIKLFAQTASSAVVRVWRDVCGNLWKLSCVTAAVV